MTTDTLPCKMSDKMARTSSFPLYDRVVGDLPGKLRNWRATGTSFADIAVMLAREYDVRVDPATVGRWCRDLEIPPVEREAAS